MFLVSLHSCLRSIHWIQVLSWEWRCSWSSADRRCSNYIWVINNFIAYEGATYTRGFTVQLMYGVISYLLGPCASSRLISLEWLLPKCTFLINSLWPSDDIWPHRSGSILAQVMAFCLMAPTNVDLSSIRSTDSHRRAISQVNPSHHIH